MAATIMMYVLPMLLGQTYDVGKDKPGLQIFPDNVADEAVEIENFSTDSQYRMVENAEEMKDFFDVSGRLSLRIKSGLVDVSGEGRYLKESSSKLNGLEILIKVHFETVTLTIPTSVKPKPEWITFSRNFLGTHYCRSITYGGDLVASIRISGSSRYDLMRIKGAVSGSVATDGGSFAAGIKGKLDKLKQSAQDSNSMEINYYASVPLHGVSYSIDGLLDLVENFPKHVKKVNGGIGNPLKMELFPLNSLTQEYPAWFENRGLTDQLNDLEDQFDDLRATRHDLMKWISEMPPKIPDSEKNRLDDFSNKINNIYGVFLKTIAEMDVSSGASTKPFDDAFNAYKDNENSMHQKYYRKFRALIKDIYKEAPELRPKIGGAHYIRWGRSECTAPETERSMSGVAVASDIKSSGGSSDFLCSPINIGQAKPEEYFPNNNPRDIKNFLHLYVSPLRYTGIMSRFKPMLGKPIACSHCRCISRTAVITKAATNTCPEGWVKEYEGYLMAASKEAVGEYICVDKEMREPYGSVTFGNFNKNNQQVVKEVQPHCGILPCETYEETKPLDCVVCTI